MKLKLYIYFFLLMFGLMNSNMVFAADSLGRLFTNEQERNRLDYVRNQKEEVEKKVVVTEDIDEIFEEDGEDVAIKDPINIKGIVERSDGKNSAWINDSNSYEGSLDTLYIQLDEKAIGQSGVKIKMPDNQTEVELKVGESYDPNSDLTPDIN